MSSPKVSEKTYCTSLIRLLVFTLTHMTFTRRSSLQVQLKTLSRFCSICFRGSTTVPSIN